MANYSGSIHHQIIINPEDVIENLIVQMAYMDEPSGNGAVIPSYLLAKEARKYVSVLLSGEGGDEICNAYDTHLAFKVRNLYRKFVPKMIRNTARFAAHQLPVSHKKLSFDFLAKRFTSGAEKSIPESHLYWRYVFRDEEKM